jgi:phospholipase C
MLNARRAPVAAVVALGTILSASFASADDQVLFSAVDNVTDVLVQHINAETVRLDISAWYLSEHSISIAIANRFAAGVPIRLIGDRGSIFEADPHTKAEFYWLASQGVPIRLRFNPTWFPEINHWKAAIFVGQNLVEFGSGNFAPTELAPVSSTNYDDETALLTTDDAIVKAFKTKFDVMWNDTTVEADSIVGYPPYLKDWDDACAHEPTGNCGDYWSQHPNRAPMHIDTTRLEPDNPSPPDLIWGQGRAFNDRVTQEILNESRRVDIVVYRLEVDNITNAILAKFAQGVPIRVIVDAAQYTKTTYPEYWLTHANIERLWVAGVPIRQGNHDGVTHMKTLITSSVATNASSNFGPNWQRDHNYFISAATKPDIYAAVKNRFDAMWNNWQFGPLQITPPAPAALLSPAADSSNIGPTPTLTWNAAPFAVSYDVYLGTSPSEMTPAARVPAALVTDPPSTYSFVPGAPLKAGVTYYWKVVSRTFATDVVPSLTATSPVWAFTTSPPPAMAVRSAANLPAQASSSGSGRGAPRSANVQASGADTATPIKHLIVLLGENRSFDHVFGTFEPNRGQTIFNLLSQRILNADGTPGPNFSHAQQWEASATGAYSIHPPKTAPYSQLPAVTVADTPVKAPFATAAAARSAEPGLPFESYDLLTLGGSGLPTGLNADPRIPRLPNGPFDYLAYLSKSDYTSSPTHRFFQMWQQIDCNVATATAANPSGCLNDLFPWVATTAGGGEGAASMGIYTSRLGLSPYFSQLARTYAMSDNFHQSVLGGSFANHIQLFYGSPLYFANADGTPGAPPAGFIENPDPQSGTNNRYTNDGYHAGSYTNCADIAQPGVASIRNYLSSLPWRPFHGCYPGEYYLLNNFAPGFFGNGSRAPLSSTDFRLPPTRQPHIGLLLSNHGVSWKYYGGGWNGGSESDIYCDHCNGFLYSTQIMTNAAERAAHLKDVTDLYADIQAGTLPSVAFVKPSEYVDGHPRSSKWELYEEFARKVIEMVQANPAMWAETAIVVTVDEAGGYWDSGYIQPIDFFGDGPRVPFIIVSPASESVGVVHTYYDHVSIDKFIERNWRLGETISARGRDNLPNPISDSSNPYVPKNGPAIGDLFEMFGR